MGLNSGSLSGRGSGLEPRENVKKHDGNALPESCPMSVIVMPLSWLPREKPPPQRSALRRVSKDEAETTEDAGILTI